MSQTYALHDSDPKNNPMVRINPAQANEFNSRGYGIFQTINEFRGPRQISNLIKINAWAVDIDVGSKQEQLERIRTGLLPTLVVESKRGYQVYWAAKDAKKEHWNALVLERLVPYYGADKNARDLARILRKPGYFHLKDPSDPFLVKKVWEWPVSYTEREMAAFYPAIASSRSPILKSQSCHTVPLIGTFWDRVAKLNCEYALTRLSGHAYVGGETYEFKNNSNGTKQIFVNGKGTSCWIDRDGCIGSFDHGGPSIYQWLNWFHKNPRRVVEMIKEIFPECRTD